MGIGATGGSGICFCSGTGPAVFWIHEGLQDNEHEHLAQLLLLPQLLPASSSAFPQKTSESHQVTANLLLR